MILLILIDRLIYEIHRNVNMEMKKKWLIVQLEAVILMVLPRFLCGSPELVRA